MDYTAVVRKRSFLDLPFELREKIYELHFIETTRITIKTQAYTPKIYTSHSNPSTLAILEVNEQIYDEATAVLCRLAVVNFPKQRSMQIMMSRVGLQAFSTIKMVELSTNEEVYHLIRSPKHLTNFFPHLKVAVFYQNSENCSMRPRVVHDNFLPPAYLRGAGLVFRHALKIIDRSYIHGIIVGQRAFNVCLRVPLVSYHHTGTMVQCHRDLTIGVVTVGTRDVVTEEQFMGFMGFWD